MTQLHAINNFIYVIGDDLFVFILCYDVYYNYYSIIEMYKRVYLFSPWCHPAIIRSSKFTRIRSATHQVYVNLDDDVDRGTIILL
jgi:hypothetical protein